MKLFYVFMKKSGELVEGSISEKSAFGMMVALAKLQGLEYLGPL